MNEYSGSTLGARYALLCPLELCSYRWSVTPRRRHHHLGLHPVGVHAALGGVVESHQGPCWPRSKSARTTKSSTAAALKFLHVRRLTDTTHPHTWCQALTHTIARAYLVPAPPTHTFGGAYTLLLGAKRTDTHTLSNSCKDAYCL
jgi:hypothetical protein